jgi:hypothetical protein
MSEKKPFTRSEQVRQRRRAHIQHQPRPPKKMVIGRSNSRELPPITMRGVVNEYAFERYKKTGRRRFNTSYSLPMANPRLLSLTHIRPEIGWRFLSFLAILLVSTGLYFLWSAPEFRIASAQVTGNQRISSDEINTMLGLNGQASFLLEPSQIESNILQYYPELKSIRVSVGLPNHVSVEVAERQPVIQWQQEGDYTWIDENGIAFRPYGEVQGLIPINALSAPPRLESSESNQGLPVPFITADTVKAVQSLATFVPQGTMIMYDPNNGFSWIDPRGWQAIFGNGSEEMPVKVHIYQSLVDWLTQRGVRPVLISVAYSNAPYYRLDQGHAEE